MSPSHKLPKSRGLALHYGRSSRSALEGSFQQGHLPPAPASCPGASQQLSRRQGVGWTCSLTGRDSANSVNHQIGINCISAPLQQKKIGKYQGKLPDYKTLCKYQVAPVKWFTLTFIILPTVTQRGHVRIRMQPEPPTTHSSRDPGPGTSMDLLFSVLKRPS